MQTRNNYFSSLRRLDQQTLSLNKLKTRLALCNVEYAMNTPVPGMYYLRFQMKVDDLGTMTVLLDVAEWVGIHVPQLDGIDWLSMDVRLLSPLVQEWPLPLLLTSDSEQFVSSENMELIDGADLATALPSIKTPQGTVWLEIPNNFPLLHITPSDAMWQATLPLTVGLGHSHVPYKLLKTIVPGDVILIEHYAATVATHGHILFEYELSEEVMMLKEKNELNDEVDAEYTKTEDQSTKQGSVNLGEIPVKVHFVLMEKEMTFDQLQQMQPGEVFQLPLEAKSNIEVRVNGKRFATGELVQLDEQLCVEIQRCYQRYST